MADDGWGEDAVRVDPYEFWWTPLGQTSPHRHVGPVTDERVRVLRRMSYSEYLETPEWRAKRQSALALAQHRCNRCGRRREVMHVHHLTYQNLGREQPEDLEVLCPRCHRDEHDV